MIKADVISKYVYRSFFNTLKKLFCLNVLNNVERKGRISSFTKLKIFPNTNIVLPFELGRTIRGLSFRKNLDKDPFALFVMELNKGKNKKDLIKYLVSLYKIEKYLNAASIIKLKKNLILSKYPAWALIMPWDELSIEEKFNNYSNIFLNNRFKNIINSKKFKKKKNNNEFYSIKNAYSQFYQTKELLRSIKKFGIKKSKSLPKINILVDGSKWRWFMTDEGNHRAYIASINGDIDFNCEVSRIIYKKDVASWHNVKNGLYKREEALLVFKHFFLGDKCLRGVV